MPHELTSTDGRTAMAFAGETPWHGLGTKLDEPATAEEAIFAAGLDYHVDLAALTTSAGTPVRQRKGVVRCDNGDVRGVVATGEGGQKTAGVPREGRAKGGNHLSGQLKEIRRGDAERHMPSLITRWPRNSGSRWLG